MIITKKLSKQKAFCNIEKTSKNIKQFGFTKDLNFDKLLV